MEIECDGHKIVAGEHGTIPPRITKGGRNQRTRRDCLDCSITKIGQNTEKSSKHLRRLTVTQTPVKDHQQALL